MQTFFTQRVYSSSAGRAGQDPFSARNRLIFRSVILLFLRPLIIKVLQRRCNAFDFFVG